MIMLATSMVVLWSYVRNIKNRRYNTRYVLTNGKRISNFNNVGYTIYKTLITKLMHFIMRDDPKLHLVIGSFLALIQILELSNAFKRYLVFYDQFMVFVLVLMFVNTITGLLMLLMGHSVIRKISLCYWQILNLMWDIYYIFLAKY
ncbi:Cytochrome c oxidase subunit 3 [Candidatus Hodgkinia cicadicola]|uniref:Cytochrome c oxidase subunit 3 n=1 Tax=Candidatus Hodgkinia cicadicola TaxID=573658 RepID=A0ABX4MJF2_9HYPH|nr:Cytochrome c oxidase subunit 3 [Candidatus Hodgkinia cicadicola]